MMGSLPVHTAFGNSLHNLSPKREGSQQHEVQLVNCINIIRERKTENENNHEIQCVRLLTVAGQFHNACSSLVKRGINRFLFEMSAGFELLSWNCHTVYTKRRRYESKQKDSTLGASLETKTAFSKRPGFSDGLDRRRINERHNRIESEAVTNRVHINAA